MGTAAEKEQSKACAAETRVAYNRGVQAEPEQKAMQQPVKPNDAGASWRQESLSQSGLPAGVLPRQL